MKWSYVESRWGTALLLAVYAAVLLATHHTVAVFEDEALIVAHAGGTSAAEMVRDLVRGSSWLEHPPLYDLVLRGWMQVTGGARSMLRIPSILFFCLGLWILGRTAHRLWGAAVPTVLAGAVWPLAHFLAVPAYWAAFTFFLIAALLWFHFRWLDSGRTRELIGFTSFAVALLYTNWFAGAVLAALLAHFLARRPPRAMGFRAVGAIAVTGLAFAPLVPAFLAELRKGPDVLRSALTIGADLAYHGYSLWVSEAVAPWHWPAALALVGLLLLVRAALVTRETRPLFLVLGFLFLTAVFAGILNGKRLMIFGPFLVLAVGGLLRCAPHPRLVVLGLTLIFGTGWAGILSERWYGTFRYSEPWDEIVEETIHRAQPGDLVLCSHPSFYFQAVDALGWASWGDIRPSGPMERSGLIFSPLPAWETAVRGKSRVLDVRTAIIPRLAGEQVRAKEYLSREFLPLDHVRFLPDDANGLKSRFAPNQPRWRVEIVELARR